MPSRFFRNVTERWVRNGTSIDGCHCNRSGIVETGGSTSYQSQPKRQQVGEFDVVQEQLRPQTIRKWGGHKTTLANVTEFEYDGIVWCVKVPTGSFVAVRNGMAFVTGNSGMPKSLDVSKNIDKGLGVEREIVGINYNYHSEGNQSGSDISQYGVSEDAKKWDGWKSSLKPAQEPIVMARKPLAGTIVQNVLKWHTGALNIDACRVGSTKNVPASTSRSTHGSILSGSVDGSLRNETGNEDGHNPNIGRFPSNFIHDGSDEVLKLFPDSNGAGKSLPQVKITGYGDKNTGTGKSEYRGGDRIPFDAGSGSAARFFYCAKASKIDRHSGLPNPGVQFQHGTTLRKVENTLLTGNNHPTVKPLSLCDWLVKLITPPNGIVLDPFNGSGSTGKAAILNDFRYIGIDLSQEYLDISEARITYTLNNKEKVKKELTTNLESDRLPSIKEPAIKEVSLEGLFDNE